MPSNLFATADEAFLDCTRRFKSLPDRHFVFSRMLKKSASIRRPLFGLSGLSGFWVERN